MGRRVVSRSKGKILFREFVKPLRKLRRKINGIGKVLKVDQYSKKLHLEQHTLIMINQSIENCQSLREVSKSTKNRDAKKKGIVDISHNRLCEVNKNRDYRAFVWIFYELVRLAIHRYHALGRVKETLKIVGIDTTFIILKATFSRHGYCGETKRVEEGIKIHLASFLGWLSIPITLYITPGDVGDSPLFEYLIDDVRMFVDLRQVILVFDRAYCKYARFKRLVEKDIRFITRMKSNARYEVLSEVKGKGYTDQRIKLRNGVELRLVIMHTKDGDMKYLTDIFDLPPFKIKMAYEQRWDMEIINRELKQSLEIDHFMGKSLNAVLIHIFCTLICYLLMAIFRMTHGILLTLFELKTCLRYYGPMYIEELKQICRCLNIDPG
jgi:hypothetical protein